MLQMTLEEIERRYREAKDAKAQIGILADLNVVESTFMAMLLREMGLDVDAMKLPRKPRNGGADAYELFQLTPEYAEAVKYRQEHGREIGRAIGYHAKEGRKMESMEKVKCKESKPVGAPEKKGTYKRCAADGDLYVGRVHGIQIRNHGNQRRHGDAGEADRDHVREIKKEPSARCRRLWQSVRDGRSADYGIIIPQNV